MRGWGQGSFQGTNPHPELQVLVPPEKSLHPNADFPNLPHPPELRPLSKWFCSCSSSFRGAPPPSVGNQAPSGPHDGAAYCFSLLEKSVHPSWGGASRGPRGVCFLSSGRPCGCCLAVLCL